MSLFSKSKRGSLGAESMTADITSAGIQPSRFSFASGSRGRDDALRVTQDIESSKDLESVNGDLGNRTMMEDVEDEYLSSDDSRSDTLPGCRSKPGDANAAGPTGSGRLHPGSILGKHKPPLQHLQDLPGLSIVTWDEFLDCPSVLCKLFEADKADFIHYNPEQINVFFHDSRMEQPTLGAPSGDGLSWTIFIDSHNHLKSVRNWLTERISVILIQLVKSKKQESAACLVAINPLNKAIGAQIHDNFSKAIDAFLQHKHFCIEINLNDCVQKWCRTALNMKCKTTGGRLVVTNADDRVPCTRVDSVPFCVLCFPVWGLRKLSYNFRRRSEYEDICVCFKAEDVSFCTNSSHLKQYAEQNNNSKPVTTSPDERKGQTWIKKNQSAVTATTQTPAKGRGANGRANLQIEEVDTSGEVNKRMMKRQSTKQDKERGQDSGFSSDSASAERCEPQLMSSMPSYRPHSFVPPRPSDKAKKGSRDQQRTTTRKTMDDTSSVSASTTYSSSPGYGNHPGMGSNPKNGAQVNPTVCVSWQVLQDVDEDDSMYRSTPRDYVLADSRAAGFVQGVSTAGSDDEHGNYSLLEETSSPRPDTPLHTQLIGKSLRRRRSNMMIQDSTIKEEAVEPSVTRSADHRPALNEHMPRTPRDVPNSMEQRSLRFNINETTTEEDFLARENKAFEDDHESQENAFKQLKDIEKVKTSPIKGIKNKRNNNLKAFPYTSEYLDYKSGSIDIAANYDLVNQDSVRGEELKKKKKNSAVSSQPHQVLFAPRSTLRDDQEQKQQVSQDDMYEDDIDLWEDGIMAEKDTPSYEQGLAKNAPALTSSTIPDHSPRGHESNNWEITDCEPEDGPEPEVSPRILPGAKGASQLRSLKESSAIGGEARKRGGVQYDSRRKYIALNSLRRKTNQSALQADLRKQTNTETSVSNADLIEF